MKYKEQRNEKTGQTRWVPVGSQVEGPSAPQVAEETRVGPLLAQMLGQTRTAQYAQKLPEIYGGIAGDIKEKGLGYYFTPEGYKEQLQKTGQILKETGAEQIGVAGELAPFFMAGGKLPEQFGKRVVAGAKRGGLLTGIHGVTGVSPEEKRAKEAGEAPSIPQAALQRFLTGTGEAVGGAVAGGAIAGITGIPKLLKGKKVKTISPTKAIRGKLGQAKAEALKEVAAKRINAGQFDTKGAGYIKGSPISTRYHTVESPALKGQWSVEQLAGKVEEWGGFAHTSSGKASRTPRGRYYKQLWELGKKVMEDEAPKVAKKITQIGKTYTVPKDFWNIIFKGTALFGAAGIAKYLWPFK